MDPHASSSVFLPHALQLVQGDPLPDPLANMWAAQAAQHSPAPIWVCDARDHPVYFNRAWMTFTGQLSPALHWMLGVHPEDHLQVSRAYSVALENRQPFTITHRLRRGDGSFTKVLNQASPLNSDDGELTGFVGSCTDIGNLASVHQTQSDEQCRAQNARNELSRCTRDLDDLAHVASHDLKEPLRGIYSNAAFALEDSGGKLDPATTTRLKNILQLVKRSESLINSILHVSQAGRAPMRRLPTDLNQLVPQVVATLHPFLRQHHATVEIAPALPQVACDPPWIAEVFAHLLVNAVKFNEQEIKHVRISGGLHGPDALIAVDDNGIGIPDRHRESVFRLCKRLHQRHRYGGGVGSGLTLCRRILERHGGTIWVEPFGHGGTRVLFTLARNLEWGEGAHGGQ